jgi:broad specificity phosphatase PhoE
LAQVGPVEYTELLREKAAGILRLKPLKAFTKNAKISGTPLREYQPKNGESWNDVLKRAQKFIIHAANFGFRDEVRNVFDFPQRIHRALCVTHGGFVMEILNFSPW